MLARLYFYPRSPCGERPCITIITTCTASFLSTLSLRRATLTFMLYNTSSLIFLSTLSLRRATRAGLNIRQIQKIISIHALLAESDSMALDQYLNEQISIHALLAESDYLGAGKSCNVCDFYPRSPCGERPPKKYPVILGRGISIHALLAESDLSSYSAKTMSVLFLSTLSLRRATLLMF